MKTVLFLALIAMALIGAWHPANARWVARWEWIEPITPFYAPVLLRDHAAWGERPAWCHHGKHWSCR